MKKEDYKEQMNSYKHGYSEMIKIADQLLFLLRKQRIIFLFFMATWFIIGMLWGISFGVRFG